MKTPPDPPPDNPNPPLSGGESPLPGRRETRYRPTGIGTSSLDDPEFLRSTLEQALQLSVRRDRGVLAAALAPVVGSAFRRSFWNLLKRGIARLNRFLVLTFSGDGLRWHLEALRTGRTFGAVMREHSLVEPVTQVLLIHRATGLLLAQASQPAIGGQDGDMVSGMLTAVQDFVHDSFPLTGEHPLEVIRVGDVSVLIEQGPLAILAGIISQGYEPKPLRETFRRVLNQIHEDFASFLEGFRGDVSAFAPVQTLLDGCLKQSMVKGEDRISPLTGMVLAAPVMALLVLGGLHMDGWLRWRRYLAALRREPGIVVVQTGWRTVRGLRDPLAADPAGMLLDYGMTDADVTAEWKSYQALDEALMAPRVRRVLDAPPTVNITIRDGWVILDGTAPAGWVEAARCRLHAVQGFRGWRLDAVREEGREDVQAWARYRSRLRNTPGLVVMEHGQNENGRFYIAGFRDPLAPDPDALLAEDGPPLMLVDRRWTPFQSLDPLIAGQRVHRLLEPPPTVTLALENGILRLSGKAPHVWIQRAGLIAGALPGVESLDMTELENTDLTVLESMIPELEASVFYYLADRQNLWPGQERRWRAFVETARHFLTLARRLEIGYQIEIRGHAPASGDADTATLASEAIAERFFQRLQQAGLDADGFVRRGMGGAPASAMADDEGRRRETHISFHVRRTRP